MIDFADFIVDLEAGLPSVHGDDAFALGVTNVELTLPIEARIVTSGGVEMSTPRGRLETGFAVEHGRVRLNFERSDLADSARLEGAER